ncbi:hypothetical protein EAF00_003823 [Botryotinia globosa]|nr:hypothetical protein EAF00_003823 [Botryotinia globosa]
MVEISWSSYVRTSRRSLDSLTSEMIASSGSSGGWLLSLDEIDIRYALLFFSFPIRRLFAATGTVVGRNARVDQCWPPKLLSPKQALESRDTQGSTQHSILQLIIICFSRKCKKCDLGGRAALHVDGALQIMQNFYRRISMSGRWQRYTQYTRVSQLHKQYAKLERARVMVVGTPPGG